MEVRIKDNNGYVDADWTIEDGIMVVSPKVDKFEPKDGDVVATKDGKQVFINKKYLEEGCGYAYIGCNFGNDAEFIEGQWCYSRFATEEEKRLLFDKLKEKGFEWDAEKKEVVKIKWKPTFKEIYYRPDFNHCQFICYSGTYDYHKMIYIKDHINKGWVFRTEEECRAFCGRLNNALNQVKL